MSGIRFTSQFCFCPNFFAADTYQGCEHSCKYCFSYWGSLCNASWVKSGKKFVEPMPLKGGANTVRNILNAERDNTKLGLQDTRLKTAMDLRMPLHIGGLSDPFQPRERTSLQTYELLKALKEFNYPFVLSTKNVLAGEYLDLLEGSVLQVSLIGFNDKVKALEPRASTPEERLELIRLAKKEGIHTVVRLQPFIPDLLDSEELDEYFKNIAWSRANSVTVEFFKMMTFVRTNPVMKEISKILGYDIVDRLSRNGTPGSSDSEFSSAFKLPLMNRLRAFADKYLIGFYSADNSLRVLGDGPVCCGYPEDFFDSKYRAYGNRAPFIAKARSKVTFFDIYDDVPDVLAFRDVGGFLNVQSDNKFFTNTCFFDFIRESWNSLTHPNNPAKFFANLIFTGETDNRFNIYYHDKDWQEKLLGRTNLFKFAEKVEKL